MAEAAREPVVPIAFVPSPPEDLFKQAVEFIEKQGDFLTRSVKCQEREQKEDLQDVSPLLVLCKFYPPLGKDHINDVIRQTRSGKDVMLLVVTDNKDYSPPKRVTQHLGASTTLFYYSPEERFRSKENRGSMVWLRDFLQQFDVDLRLRMGRTASARSSFKQLLGYTAESGWYCAYPLNPPQDNGSRPLTEELVKNVLVFFSDTSIDLKKAHDTQKDSPLLLLCSEENVQQAAAYLEEERLGSTEAMLLVLRRSINTGDSDSKALPNIRFKNVHQLWLNDVTPRVLSDYAPNKITVRAVRKFFAKRSQSALRQLGKQRASSTANDGEHGSKEGADPDEGRLRSVSMDDISLRATGEPKGRESPGLSRSPRAQSVGAVARRGWRRNQRGVQDGGRSQGHYITAGAAAAEVASDRQLAPDTGGASSSDTGRVQETCFKRTKCQATQTQSPSEGPLSLEEGRREGKRNKFGCFPCF